MSKNVSKATNMKAQRIANGFPDSRGISDLAKKAGVSDRHIITLENGGTLRNHELQKIADALGVSLATLGQVEL